MRQGGNLYYFVADHLGSTSVTLCDNTSGCYGVANGGKLGEAKYVLANAKMCHLGPLANARNDCTLSQCLKSSTCVFGNQSGSTGISSSSADTAGENRTMARARWAMDGSEKKRCI